MKTAVEYMEDLPHRHRTPQLSKTAERFLTLAVALLLLVPCFWQPHIAAGDLASHSYNAWLANEIRNGRAPGLEIVNPITNVLGDWILDFLLNRYGREWAEPILIGISVETFFWGAFFWIARIHGRRSWLIAPSLGMLTFGMVYHFGFVNFYLATGIALWILYLLWQPSKRRALIAAALSLAGILAHVLPVAWALGILVYHHLSKRFSASQRPVLLVGGASILVLAIVILTTFLPNKWTLDQVLSLSGFAGLVGVEQVWLYGVKYLIIAIGLFLLWGVLFLERIDSGHIESDTTLHLWILNILAFAALPGAIQFPGSDSPLMYIPERLSLFIGLTFLAMVAGGRHGRSLTRSSGMLAAVFFTTLYLDERTVNRIEKQVLNLVAELPSGQRVVTQLYDSGSPRMNGLVHVGSGACLGRCYDYGNYEPATRGQFRIRVTAPNPFNADNVTTVREIEEGRHVVTKEEAPLYSICSGTEENSLVLKKLNAGEKTCTVSMKATAQFTD